jgi:hypothetical protein
MQKDELFGMPLFIANKEWYVFRPFNKESGICLFAKNLTADSR